MARVSAADVARAAGVSGQTVSRVVNGSDRVDPATRERVERAMSRLGYRPHRAARALRTGRTRAIGVVVRTLASVGNTRMLEAVTHAAARREHAVIVVTLREEGFGPADPVSRRTATGFGPADAAFAVLEDQGVDGAVVLNEATPEATAAPADPPFPVVAVDSATARRFTIVESDHAGGARELTEHLLSLGHATVHHVAGPHSSYAAAERERGWRSALRARGAGIPEPHRGEWTAATGYAHGRRLAADPRVTAVFAANDQLALGVLHAAHEAGRSLAIAGFDDVLDAKHFWPPLTTVAQDFDALGESAVAALLERVEGRAVPDRTVIPTRLVTRTRLPPG